MDAHVPAEIRDENHLSDSRSLRPSPGAKGPEREFQRRHPAPDRQAAACGVRWLAEQGSVRAIREAIEETRQERQRKVRAQREWGSEAFLRTDEASFSDDKP